MWLGVFGGDFELEGRLSETVLAEVAGFVVHETVGIERRDGVKQTGDGFLVGAEGLGRSDLPLAGITLREVQLFPALFLDLNLGNVFLLQGENFGRSIDGSLGSVLGRGMTVGPVEHAAEGGEDDRSDEQSAVLHDFGPEGDMRIAGFATFCATKPKRRQRSRLKGV